MSSSSLSEYHLHSSLEQRALVAVPSSSHRLVSCSCYGSGYCSSFGKSSKLNLSTSSHNSSSSKHNNMQGGYYADFS